MIEGVLLAGLGSRVDGACAAMAIALGYALRDNAVLRHCDARRCIFFYASVLAVSGTGGAACTAGTAIAVAVLCSRIPRASHFETALTTAVPLLVGLPARVALPLAIAAAYVVARGMEPSNVLTRSRLDRIRAYVDMYTASEAPGDARTLRRYVLPPASFARREPIVLFWQCFPVSAIFEVLWPLGEGDVCSPVLCTALRMQHWLVA